MRQQNDVQNSPGASPNDHHQRTNHKDGKYAVQSVQGGIFGTLKNIK
jgi:hypothetical protein